jgi:hypothetical protein
VTALQKAGRTKLHCTKQQETESEDMERYSECDWPCGQPDEVERQDTVSNIKEIAHKTIDDKV